MNSKVRQELDDNISLEEFLFFWVCLNPSKQPVCTFHCLGLDDIYIMMQCLSVTKNEHFLKRPACLFVMFYPHLFKKKVESRK